VTLATLSLRAGHWFAIERWPPHNDTVSHFIEPLSSGMRPAAGGVKIGGP
jgi:hypothetical protein